MPFASTLRSDDMPTPRIAFRSSADTSGDVQRVLEKLEASGRDLPIVKLVANWDGGFRPFILMADALLTKGALPPATREITVLRIATVRSLDYEWHEHEPMAIRAGVRPDQIAKLANSLPLDDTSFSAEERAAVAVVDDLLAGGEPDADHWDNACAMLGDDAALELIFAVAWWGGFVPVAVQALFSLAGEVPESVS